MPDPHHHLSKDSVQQALRITAGRLVPPNQLMQMRTTEGKVVPRPTAPPPGVTATPAAVLVLLYNHDQELHLVLTRRTTHLRRHAGQISFPGGRADAQDPSLYATALREAQEELGVDPASVSLWCDLTTVYVSPTNYQIYPFIGYCDRRPEFQPNLSEVHEVVELPLRHLFLPDSVATEQREMEGQTVLVPHYLYRGHIIWGATAKVLVQLTSRIQAGLQSQA